MYIKRKVENCICWVEEKFIAEFDEYVTNGSTMYLMLASFAVDIENDVLVKDRTNGGSIEGLLESYIELLNKGNDNG